MQVVLGSQMKKIDEYTIHKTGIPSMVLMERAAYAVVEQLVASVSKKERILCVCGMGNNGADGIAVGRILHQKGYMADILLVGKMEKATQEWKLQKQIADRLQIPLFEWHRQQEQIENGQVESGNVWAGGTKNRCVYRNAYTWIVDGLFGVGLTRNVEDPYAQVIEAMNRSTANIISVDLPSGLNGDNGQRMGVTVDADVTVTFGTYKTGLLFYPGKELAGEVIVADIGLDKNAYNHINGCSHIEEGTNREGQEADDISYIEVLEQQELYLAERQNYSNKGSFGKVYIIGGACNMAGAVCMSAMAAYRMGAGLVKVQTVEQNRQIVQSLVPQAVLDTDEAKIQENLQWADSIVMGPGLGIDERWLPVIIQILQTGKRVVLDADALNIIASNNHVIAYFHENVVITPHLGELSRLINEPVSVIQQDLMGYCKKAKEHFKCVCIIKDAVTLVSHKEKLFLNTTGNHGMAVGGSGDVLAGMIGALLFDNKMSVYDCAKYGVYLHGMAGDCAAEKTGKRSMIATDILDAIPDVIEKIDGKIEKIKKIDEINFV